jgi:hypothetical protein
MLEFKQLLPYLPFLSAAIVGKEINTSNIISRLIEVGIIGGIILYASVQVLETRFGGLEEKIIACNQSEKILMAEIKANTNTITNMLLQLETLKIQNQYSNELIKRHVIDADRSKN